MARDWKKEAVSGGQYLKFESGTKLVVHFISGPEPHEFEARDGKTVRGWEWVVDVDGEQKVLSVTSKRLLAILADEDDEEELNGRSLQITALGDGMNRQWRVRPANTRKLQRQDEFEDDEEEEEEEPKPKTTKKAKPEPVEEVYEDIDEFEAAAKRKAKGRGRGRKKKVEEDE